MTGESDISVVLPAFNERQVIKRVLSELKSFPYNVIVVDDGSVDDTAQQALVFPVVVLRHVCNLGQGAALQTGITYALSCPGTRYIVTFDADGQHSASDIPQLLNLLRAEEYDVVLGSRFLRAGDAVNIEVPKRALLRLAVSFTRLITGLKITDTHNGLRAFTFGAASKIRITQNRMAHASETSVLRSSGDDLL